MIEELIGTNEPEIWIYKMLSSIDAMVETKGSVDTAIKVANIE